MTSVTINKPGTLIAGNIRSGVNIAGVTGKTTVVDTAITEGSATFPITEDAVLVGYKGYVNGVGIDSRKWRLYFLKRTSSRGNWRDP